MTNTSIPPACASTSGFGRAGTRIVMTVGVAMLALVAASANAWATPPGSGVVQPDGALISPTMSYPGLGSLNKPIVGWAPAPAGGAWEVANDGGVFARNAPFYGSTGNIHLNQPIVGMASTADGAGYWLVASDGGIFTFGDAPFLGSTGAIRLNLPIVGMAATPDGRGYWLAASDGGVFSFGDASFYGSTGNIKLNQPIVGMAATPGGAGYWLVASDGGVFSFGDAPSDGSASGRASAPAVSVAPANGGYDVTLADDSVWAFGPGNPGTEQPLVALSATGTESSTQQQVAETAVAAALAQVGKPYVDGGAGPDGFDCSGLVQFAYAAAGVAIPRTTNDQLAELPQVPLTDVQPGDLLFFYPGITHVGIYLGNGLMVDAPHPGANVRVEAFSPGFGPVMGITRPA